MRHNDVARGATELLGMVLAPALFFRAAVHVLTAGAVDRDPHLSDDSDVTLRSPVPSLRGHKNDALARLGSVALALVLAWGAPTLPLTSGGLLGGVVLWLVANWAVLASDPVAWIVNRGIVFAYR